MSDNPAPLKGRLANIVADAPELPDLLRAIQARTPARILVGRAGASYRTATQLQLRQDHAAALDAVHAEFEAEKEWDSSFVSRWKLFTVQSCAGSKSEYLARPDLGRRLNEPGRAHVALHCPHGAGLQVIVGDGLSAAAVATQVPRLLPMLEDAASLRGWSLGQPFVVRYCRVGILNDIGEILKPVVAVLLIGERPGLATAESLSAYMAYQPRPGHTDAERNLVSNIHARGVAPHEAVERIMALAATMRLAQTSGVSVKEELKTIEPDLLDEKSR